MNNKYNLLTRLFGTFFIFSTLFITTAHAQWTKLGGVNDLGANNYILAICSDPSGNIYAAGQFTNASGKYYVAKWDGNTWSELGGLNALGADSFIYTICSDPAGNIYAAGPFKNSSGHYYVAKYDGSSWSQLGDISGYYGAQNFNSLCSDPSGNIYLAATTDTFLNNIWYSYIVKYDGSSWSVLGGTNGLFNNAEFFTVCSDRFGNIDAGGGFNGNSADGQVVQYNGSIWNAVDTNDLIANDDIYAIYSDTAGNIYAAGLFSNIDGSSYVAKWDGTAWSELGGTNALTANNSILSVCGDTSGNIYAAGQFTNSTILNGLGYNYVAMYNGSTWSELGGTNSFAPNGDINAICSDASGNIYAAGIFTDSSGKYYVAKYVNNQTTHVIIYHKFCQGSGYGFDTTILTVEGTYSDTLTAVNGYDSITILHLSYTSPDSIHAQFTLQPSSTPHLWYILNQSTGTPPLSYRWSWGDGSPASIGDTPSHTYDSAGYYTICVTVSDSLGCFVTYCDSNAYLFKDQSGTMISVDVVNQLPNGIIEPKIFTSIEMYPNPASGTVTIISPENIQTFKVISQTGEVVQHIDGLNSNQLTLSISYLAQGIYYVQVTGTDHTTVKKLVVE